MAKILTIVAHPDDETMLSGGTLALLASAGAEVHYLCATRGEGGEVGEPPISSREALGVSREREMRCAVQTLGGAGVVFLDYIDPLVGEDDQLHAYTEDFEGLVAVLRAQIQRFRPVAVITHGSSGEYGHPAHILTHYAALKVIEGSSDQAILFYTFSAAFPEHPRPRLTNEDDPAHIVLDITPVLKQKTDAALCHKSQHALFVRRSSIQVGRQLTVPEVIIPVEALHRVSPPVNGEPDDLVIELLKPWAVTKT